MILKINVMNEMNEIKIPKGVESISVTQHDDKIVIDFMPKKPKFKVGDEVIIKKGISSETHRDIFPCFTRDMDDYIGQKLVISSVQWHTNGAYLYGVDENMYIFLEDWLEPYVEELKKGDWAIFWDNKSLMPLMPLIRLYHGKTYSGNSHIDNFGTPWDNAVKWDGTKEQFEKVLRGEI